MDKELQQALAAMISKTTQAAEAGAAFLRAELPDVIRQLLVWKASEAAIFAVLWFVMAAVFFYGSRRVIKWIHEDKPYGDRWLAYIPLTLAGIFTVRIVVDGVRNVAKVIQIAVAPKIYLIEYAASLAQGAAK